MPVFSHYLIIIMQRRLHIKITSYRNLATARTSDSLNEGLPIKMTREKFQRK